MVQFEPPHLGHLLPAVLPTGKAWEDPFFLSLTPSNPLIPGFLASEFTIPHRYELCNILAKFNCDSSHNAYLLTKQV